MLAKQINTITPYPCRIYFDKRVTLTFALLLFFNQLLFIQGPAAFAAEAVSDPVAKLRLLREDLEKELQKAEQEKSSLNNHLVKCNQFLSSLNSGKDQAAISVTKEAIEKDRAAIAKIEERIKEIKHRLKLTDRAKQYLTGGQQKGIGLSCQEIKGDVHMVRGGQKIRLHDGMYPLPGDTIVTAKDSHVMLMTLDGSIIYLKGNSSFELIEDNFDNSVSKMLKGKAGIFIAHTKKMLNRRYQVRSPNCAVSVRGTKFDIEVDDNGLTHIDVQEGTVEVTKTVILEKGQAWTE
ncbi:MAG: FecR domain-containing protein [Candidatus Omnitrophota bacterium]